MIFFFFPWLADSLVNLKYFIIIFLSQALPSTFRQRGLTDREQMDSDIIREYFGVTIVSWKGSSGKKWSLVLFLPCIYIIVFDSLLLMLLELLKLSSRMSG